MLHLSIPSPDINFVDFGPVRIYFYALCILAGIVVATVVTNRRLTRRGGESWIVIDFAVWTVALGIVGARVYHVLSHPGDYFYEGANLLRVFAINEGGIAIFGALLGGAVGAFIASRLTGVRFWSFADALVPGLLLAQAFGRLGNYFNQELFGTPTTLPWGLQIDATNAAFPIGLPPETLFQPAFLYEILWNLLGLVILLSIERRMHPRWGTFFGMYLIWYGLGRVWIETIRLDPSEMLLGIRTNVWTALLAIIVGLLVIIIQRSEHPGLEVSVYRAGYTKKASRLQGADAHPEEYYDLKELASSRGLK